MVISCSRLSQCPRKPREWSPAVTSLMLRKSWESTCPQASRSSGAGYSVSTAGAFPGGKSSRE